MCLRPSVFVPGRDENVDSPTVITQPDPDDRVEVFLPPGEESHGWQVTVLVWAKSATGAVALAPAAFNVTVRELEVEKDKLVSTLTTFLPGVDEKVRDCT